MAFWRASQAPSDPVLHELDRECQTLEQKAREYEEFLREAPKRLALERAERAATMPPPDDLADRQREKSFYEQLSRGQLRNVRRAQAGSTLLFLLLLAATAALVMWMLRVAQPMM